MYYSCTPGVTCDINLVYNNFTSNAADNKGGAVLWVNKNATTAIKSDQTQRRMLSH